MKTDPEKSGLKVIKPYVRHFMQLQLNNKLILWNRIPR